MAVGDFNNDGKQDLAVADSKGNNVRILLGNGAGTLQAVPDIGPVVGASVASFFADERHQTELAKLRALNSQQRAATPSMSGKAMVAR